jgi:hypothetical protein
MRSDGMVASPDRETLLEQLEAEFLSSDAGYWQFDSETRLADLQRLALGDEPKQWYTCRRTRPPPYCCR